MSGDGELARRVALVTGAGQGLGAATARVLAEEGARVVLADLHSTPALVSLVDDLGGLSMICDMSDPDAVSAAVAEVEQRAGRIDVFISNHAVMTRSRFLEHDPPRWWRDIEINLSGAYYGTRAVLPGMRARGYGRIVYVSSSWGITGAEEATAYSASKAGLISLARSLALELARENIAVNAVAPGTIDTPQLEVDAAAMGVPLDEARRRFAEEMPLKRIAQPREIARTIAYLACERAGAMVGQVLQPNGGIVTGRG
jgi:NAD(P)-dependent dehydrogenase (short-subunit alcohol dehydrogenase family)